MERGDDWRSEQKCGAQCQNAFIGQPPVPRRALRLAKPDFDGRADYIPSCLLFFSTATLI